MYWPRRYVYTATMKPLDSFYEVSVVIDDDFETVRVTGSSGRSGTKPSLSIALKEQAAREWLEVMLNRNNSYGELFDLANRIVGGIKYDHVTICLLITLGAVATFLVIYEDIPQVVKDTMYISDFEDALFTFTEYLFSRTVENKPIDAFIDQVLEY